MDTNQVNPRLKEMMEKYEDAYKTANEDLSGWPSMTLPGKILSKREAEDTLKQVKDSYKNLIVNSFVKVFVDGPKVSEFKEYLEKNNGLVVDGNLFYEEFARNIEPSMDSKDKNFTGTQMVMLINLLQRWMERNAIGSIASPSLDAMEMTEPNVDLEALTNRVRKALEKGNGTELLRRELENRIYQLALEKKYTTTIVPVVIVGLTKNEVSELSKNLFGGQQNISVTATNKKTNQQLTEEINSKIVALFNKK